MTIDVTVDEILHHLIYVQNLEHNGINYQPQLVNRISSINSSIISKTKSAQSMWPGNHLYFQPVPIFGPAAAHHDPSGIGRLGTGRDAGGLPKCENGYLQIQKHPEEFGVYIVHMVGSNVFFVLS